MEWCVKNGQFKIIHNNDLCILVPMYLMRRAKDFWETYKNE